MVFEKVKQMLAEQLDADIDSLTMETNIATAKTNIVNIFLPPPFERLQFPGKCAIFL